LDALQTGIILAQTGDYHRIHTVAVNKMQVAAVAYADLRPSLSVTERPHFERHQDGATIQTAVAVDTQDKADNLREDELPMEVTIVDEAAPLQQAAPPQQTAPRRPQSLPKGVSRDIVDTITQAMAPQSAAAAGRSGAPNSRTVRLGDTRRERILALANSFSGGNSAKLQQFQQAIAVAASTGLRIDDARFRDVSAYLKQLVASNPRLGKLIQIQNGVIHVNAPPNLFSGFNKVSSLVGMGLILTNNDKTRQLQMRDLLLAASSPNGLDLNDPKLGPLAKQAIAIAKQNAAIFGKDLFQERDGHLFVNLDAKERQDLTAYYAYFETDKHSAAAQKLEGIQNEAVTAMNASITAAATAMVAMTLLTALGQAGTVPLPLGGAKDSDPARAGPDTTVRPSDTGDQPVPHTPPPAPQAPAAATTRTVAPPELPGSQQAHDSATHDLQTAIRRADTALAESRAERQRSAAKRDADIRAEAEQADQLYVAALDKQTQIQRDLAKDAETTVVAKVQRADGSQEAVAIDRRNQVKAGKPPASE
jgi:hypothetical protein